MVKVILTALTSVVALFLIAKLMGHKQVAQLDFFDYISGITIGSIAAELATELESPQNPLIALGIYGVASILLNFLTGKFPKSRKYINGTPTILMNDGKIYRDNFDLNELKTVIFEHNGKLSVLPKAESRPLTPADLKIPSKAAHIGTELIMDGRVMGENLVRIGRNEVWLEKQLRSKGYQSVREIFLGIYHAEEDRLLLYPVVERVE